MKPRIPFAALAILLAAGALPAARADTTGIVAHHGKVVETAKAGLATQGFLEIDNAASLPDTLTTAKCPIAGTTGIVGQNGAPLGQLPVAAGAHLLLDAAGPHLLLQATHFTIDHGGAIPCTLTFQNAGDILVYLYAIPAA